MPTARTCRWSRADTGTRTYNRRVDGLLDFGEGDDLVELLVNLRFLHAEEGAVQEEVLAAGEFGVEAGADFEQGGDSAAKRHRTARRGGEAGEDFEEGGFAGAVAADELERCAFRRTSPRFTSKLTSLSAQKVSISDSGLGRATGKGLNRGERGGRGEGPWDCGLGRATGKGLNRGETQWVSGERGERREDRSDWGLAEG